MADPRPADWGYRPSIDGLRTVAIYLVVLFHAGVVGVANGFIGVDVFFVLSGYLVTNMMMSEHRRTGRLSLRRFYARRVRRLLPAAVVLVVIVSGLTTLVLPRLTRLTFVDDARSSLLYVANWHFLGEATDYFADDVGRSPFLHFWSLAIEEQFYFVYPLVLVGLLLAARQAKRSALVPWTLAALMALSLMRQLTVAGDDPLRAYYGTDARLYQLLAGAVLAAAWQTRAAWPTADRVLVGRVTVAGVVAMLAVAGILLTGTDAVDLSASSRGILATALTVATIIGIELATGSLVGRALARRTMVYLGQISYGTYLWHWPLMVMAREVVDLSPWQMAVFAGLGATVMAALSYHFIERPIRRSRPFDGVPRTVVLAGLSCSVLVAALVIGPLLRNHTRPALAERRSTIQVGAGTPAAAAEALAAPVPLDLDVESTEPPVDHYPCTPDDLDTCVLRDGDADGLRVHVIGDSNAMMLIPMLAVLAEQYDFTLSASVRLGCPWQLGLGWDAQDPTLVRDCIEARNAWYERVIPALQPDVVIAINVPRDEGSRPDAFFEPAGDAGGRTIDEVVADATETSLDALTADGAEVVLFEPLPYDRQNPVECLSGVETVGDCAYEANVQPFPTELTYRAQDAGRDDVVAIDADSLACPLLPICAPMLDGELVFRNEFHLSNEWLVDHAEQWWARLTESGALD
jgi:peptidoglycan/LPS O-acetylase OafA/YrhL